jgi:hypothetical protein
MNMHDAPPPKKRTWLWVLLGIFLFFVIVAAGGLFFAVSFFRQNMQVTPMNAASAQQEFEAVRARFAGRQPLFQLVDGGAKMMSDRGSESPAPAPPSTMHILAWDDGEEQLFRVSVPFWLLRLKSGPIEIASYAQGLPDRNLTFRVEDLERHGPGLLLDLPHQRDGQLIIWAE